MYNTASKSLGNLLSWDRHVHGLTGETSFGKFNITFYNEFIVKISITREESFSDFSYATIAAPQPVTGLLIAEQENVITLSTARFTLKILKNPVRFIFETPDHRIINEDESFGTAWIGDQVTTYKKLQPGERFIGLGEKTGVLDRKGSGYQNWNTDNFGYSTGADPLYCSIPFYIGVHNHLAYGIFLDNSHKSFFNFGASNNRFSSFSADAGDMNYYFIYTGTVAGAIQEYTYLTGRMELPPLWSLGYQQCRYSYYPDKEVLNIARTFREKDIPADVVVLDIHYMEDYKIFTWSNKRFPDPRGLVAQLTEMGFKVVVICDPGIKVQEGYAAYDEGIAQKVFLQYPDGTHYTGQVWPGWCHFPDFTDAATREWWQQHMAVYTDTGVEGFWNDMNEIASWGNMLPENIGLHFEGRKGTMREGRNIYGLMMAKATYEGAKALLKGKRPFNLTRAGFSGVQRYGAVWTGDNVSYDEHMILGVRIVNSMGLSGVAFAGYDIGGFVGEANSRLYARWISLGALSPFFRGHTMINSRDSEPWSYGEEVELISRNYIKFRYQLMPYLYCLFYEASKSGMPVQRSLAIDYTHDSRIYDHPFHNQYLFGPAFLVCPAESHKDLQKVYLPEGEWYYLYTGVRHIGNAELVVECPLSRLPVFVKAGSIVPMQPVKSNTTEKTGLLILHVYTGTVSSSFRYYEDDGSTFNYQQHDYHVRDIVYHAQANTLTLRQPEGTYTSAARKLKVVFHGLGKNATTLVAQGVTYPLYEEKNRFFAALEKFDPFYDPEPAPEEPVHSIELDYPQGELTLHW